MGTELLRFSLRLLRREWRHGELQLFIAALILAVASATMISLFADRLGRAVRLQSADLLGADLVLESTSDAVPAAWLDRARPSLQTSTTLEFASVVIADNGLRLASIKAVDDHYPLRGQLRISDQPYGEDYSAPPPRPGTVWAETRLLQDLDVRVHDKVQIGAASFSVAAVLTLEPSRGGDFFNLAPRLLMHLDDIPATQVLQPGSRVTWRYLFAGEAEAVNNFKDWLAPQLNEHQRLIDVREGRPGIARALERGESFLALATLAALALSGIAIALAARRYAARHQSSAALLRCFGMQRRDLLRLYNLQLAMIGLIGIASGLLAGWLGENLILAIFRDNLPSPLPPATLQPFLAGSLVGVGALFAFALPPIRSLAGVPPLRVLQQSAAPASINRFMGFLVGFTGLLVIAGWLIRDIKVVTAFGLIGLAITLLAMAMTRLLHYLTRGRSIALGWGYGLRNLGRHAGLSTIQLLAFTLTLLLMATLAGLRGSLIEEWQNQLPDDTPNHFAINIQPDQKPAFAEQLAQLPINETRLYPMVRGRLTQINGTPVRQAVTKEAQDNNALRRELNLTWTAQLPEGNRIVAGEWRMQRDGEVIPVSIESRLAERLGIKLNDELGFLIGATRLTARVTSLRTVEWESFQPNFYMIFPPQVLETYPHTFMTSFYLPPNDRLQLAELVTRFPAVTLIDIDLLLDEVRRIQNQVILAIEYILVFVLATGALVTLAAVLNTLDSRRQEAALLRSLGATNRQLRLNLAGEFGCLGLIAGVVAALGGETLRYLLFERLFNIETVFMPWQLTWLPLASAVFVAMLGLWATRDVLRTSPLKLLADY